MKKLTLILGLLLSNLANAASTTYYSGLVPLTGSYNIDLNNTCAPDSSYANSLPPVTGVNEALVGILTITPDTTQTSKVSSLDAYNKWLAYMTPLTGVPSLAPPALSQLKDPTNALVNINETPIQWGGIKQTTTESDVSSPYTSSATPYHYIETAYFVITKYTYSNSSLNNGITTGYKLYHQSNGSGWARANLYVNAFTTSPTLTSSTNAIVLLGYSDQKSINSQNYTFNCRSKINLMR